MSVIHNTKRPESNLKNKSKSICYHDICDSVAMVQALTGNIETNKNCADLATKVLYGEKRRFHLSNLLCDVYDYM